jgi:hypothetical protein
VPIFHVTDASLEEVKAYCKLTQLMATGGARPPRHGMVMLFEVVSTVYLIYLWRVAFRCEPVFMAKNYNDK